MVSALSFDIDSIDPSACPGTGTPEIGGLTTAQALEIVRGCKGLNLVSLQASSHTLPTTTHYSRFGVCLFIIRQNMNFGPNYGWIYVLSYGI